MGSVAAHVHRGSRVGDPTDVQVGFLATQRLDHRGDRLVVGGTRGVAQQEDDGNVVAVILAQNIKDRRQLRLKDLFGTVAAVVDTDLKDHGVGDSLKIILGNVGKQISAGGGAIQTVLGTGVFHDVTHEEGALVLGQTQAAAADQVHVGVQSLGGEPSKRLGGIGIRHAAASHAHVGAVENAVSVELQEKLSFSRLIQKASVDPHVSKGDVAPNELGAVDNAELVNPSLQILGNGQINTVRPGLDLGLTGRTLAVNVNGKGNLAMGKDLKLYSALALCLEMNAGAGKIHMVFFILDVGSAQRTEDVVQMLGNLKLGLGKRLNRLFGCLGGDLGRRSGSGIGGAFGVFLGGAGNCREDHGGTKSDQKKLFQKFHEFLSFLY